MKKMVVGAVAFLTVGSLVAGCAQQPPVIVVPQVTQQTTVEKTDTPQVNDVSYVTPQEIGSEKVLSPEKIKKLVDTYNANLGYKPDKLITWDSLIEGGMTGPDEALKSYYTFYKVGKLNMAPYADWDLLVMHLGCDGPCMSGTILRFVQNPANGDLVLLSKLYDLAAGSNYYFDVMKDIYTKDANTTLASLEMPLTLAIPGTSEVVKLKSVDSDYIPENGKGAKDGIMGYTAANYKTKLFDSIVGPVYANIAGENDAGVGCVHVLKPDGSVATYSFDFGYDNDKITMKTKDGTVVNLNSNYVPADKGCGIGNSCYYTRGVNENNLEEYATLSNGLKLFKPIKTVEKAEAKDFQGQADISMIATMYQSYSQSYPYGNKLKPLVTFKEYLATTPVLFWQDPFKRWSALLQIDYQPAGECGKPVVYLYPERDMKVNYGVNGWTVLARSNGRLTNLADGKDYPYLFWEGQSQKTVETEGGFVVARADLNGFLNKTLDQAGLNKQESKDFMEFWYPRMMANREPYFILKFLGTQDFNKIAPLNITPKPDTLARFFMYYQPSDFKVNLRPQIINGFSRNGFTVVEWGGTSNTAWLQ